MNKDLKIFVSVIAAIFIAGASLTYGAMTTPKRPVATPEVSISQLPSPTPETSSTPTPRQLTPEKQLQAELPKVQSILEKAYPKSATDYTLGGSKLYSEGKWFGAQLTYRGTNTMNRDTLRILMEKKDNSWILRTSPPRILLSRYDFPDVPVSVLSSINTAVSLPAGGENSPAITQVE